MIALHYALVHLMTWVCMVNIDTVFGVDGGLSKMGRCPK